MRLESENKFLADVKAGEVNFDLFKCNKYCRLFSRYEICTIFGFDLQITMYDEQLLILTTSVKKSTTAVAEASAWDSLVGWFGYIDSDTTLST